MKNPIHMRLVEILAVFLTLATITLFTGCSQKTSSEDTSAQIQAAVDKAVAAEKRKQETTAYQQAMTSPPPPANQVICPNCGMVVSIKPVQAEGQGSGLGVIAGGVLGGLLGNQVGNGSGRDLATIAGAVGGAVTGNKVEKEAKKTTTYNITVRMDNGKTSTFNQATLPSLAIDQRVKIENGRVVKF